MGPDERSVKFTTTGAHPLLGDMVKFAVCATATDEHATKRSKHRKYKGSRVIMLEAKTLSHRNFAKIYRNWKNKQNIIINGGSLVEVGREALDGGLAYLFCAGYPFIKK
jgi:hypothetical protein